MGRPVLVVDYDLTLADADGEVGAATKAALQRWRDAGGIVVINTGRPLWDIAGDGAHTALFPGFEQYVDAVVFDNGGGILAVAGSRVLLLDEPIPDDLAAIVTAAFTPSWIADRKISAKTLDPAGPADDPNLIRMRRLVEEYNRAQGTRFQVSQNIATINVLPEGIDKLVGLTAALDLLRARGITPGLLIGCGDASNDLSFLDGCDLSIAVEQGARLAGLTDFTAPAPSGDGVAQVADTLRGRLGSVDTADRALAGSMTESMTHARRVTRRAFAVLQRARARVNLRAAMARGAEFRDVDLGPDRQKGVA